MYYRLFPFTVILLLAIASHGQTPQNISVAKLHSVTTEKAFACPDQYAGTITFANFSGQSNDTDPDTIYLCEGDMFDVVHNGDADLTGDPNPATTPGVTYIWYDCPPTIDGPNLDAILTDGCIFVGPPPPTNGFYVTAGGNFNGNQTFNNGGALQATFNGGDPLLLWFAPITIDNFSLKQYESDGNEVGPCVNVNTDEAFAVVYLNEVELDNLNPNTGTSGCSGSVEVNGGLPEFDGTEYDVTISLMGNPSVQGTVTNGPITHGDVIQFDVPAPGLYEIVVEDGKSCGATITANMTGCINVTQSIENAVAAPGENICIDVTVEGGFENIQAMQYAITFDPTILQYTGVQNITSDLPSFNQSSFSFNNDTLRISWFQAIGGTSLPDGTVLFSICFDVIGQDGECTDVPFVEIGPITDIEIIDENGNELGFNGIAGVVCVSNAALQATAVQDSVSCPGGMDGGFEVTVTGGTPPYDVTWQNTMGGPVNGPGVINVDGGSFSVSNLPEGTYIITITDDAGVPLTAIEQVEVLGPPMLNILFNENPGLCNGDLGSIQATLVLDSVILNDVSNYSFDWSNGGDTPTITNVFSGNYTLNVTDNTNGCVVSDMVFLPQPAALDVNISIDSATCTGLSDGIISVLVTGGTPNANGDYTITIGATTIMNNTGSLMAESGDYLVTVTDANGCSFQQDVFLPAIKVLSISPVINNVDCNGNCNGSIAVTGLTQGGTPTYPYSFSWSGTPNPPPAMNTPPNESQINGLCVGTYTVLMQDPDGCEVDSTFEIIQPTPMSLTIVDVVDETCQPGMDGSITIAVTGGSFPFDYEWIGTMSTDSIATGLSAGVYTANVTDSEGCIESVSATVETPDPPVIQAINDVTIDCADGMDGTLTVVPANPGNIIQYTWSSGDQTETATGLSPGVYTVTITDFNQCTAVDSATVTAPDSLMLDSIGLTSPTCVGGTNGQVSVIISGGTPGYTYMWSDPSGTNNAVLPSVAAGEYTVTVSDANGCGPLEIGVFLPQPPSIVVDFSAIDSVSCANVGSDCDGTATATAMYSDGTAGVFNFTWLGSGETTMNSNVSTATELCKGLQQVMVADQECVDTFEVDIPAPLPITPGQSIDNVSCNGFSDGEITLMPNGGTPPYSIVWANGTIGPVLSGLSAGNYTAVITDNNGCSFTHTVTVVEPAPLVLTLNPTETNNVSCAGEDDGRISVVASGGTLLGNETYIWQNNVAPLDSDIAEDLSAGTYTVTIVDSRGCEAELTHTVIEPEPIGFILGDIEPINCFGGNTSISIDSAWGGTGTLRFRVDGGPATPINQFASGFIAGDHTITVFDVNNCETSTTVNIDQPLEVVVDLPDVVEIELGDSLTSLDPIIISSVPIDSFIWSPPNQLSCTDCKNPRVNPIEDQQYTLVVIDINGCTGSGTVFVDLDRNRNVYIPNIFSPNGDGINDDFKIHTGPGVSAINFVRIYDRWGDLIHDVDSPVPSVDGTAAWDGTFRGDEMNPAVFLYLIEVVFQDGEVLVYRGDITLIR